MDFIKLSTILVLCGLIYINSAAGENFLKKNPSATTPQIVAASGYPSERHRAYTSDGYILQLHRIPGGKRSARRSGEPRAKGKKPVLLVSGLLGSSGDFVVMGPERSLAFILADAGYDVWIGNLRGDVYTAHKNLTRSDPAFWEYSFHEHGKYDLPAMIDRILNITGLPKLLYIGYSMGTTSFFIMMSEKPEYNEKIVAFVALAPAVYLDQLKYLVNLLLNDWKLTETMRAQGILAVTVNQQVLEWVTRAVCTAKSADYDVCLRMSYLIIGEDYEQNDWEITPILITRFQPASWRQLEHFGKIALTGVFTKWEDGLHGAVKPYNLSNVKVPVLILYGENDQLTPKDQIMRLAKELNSTGALESIQPACSWPKFNHLDFVIAKDVGTLLNKPLVKHINKLYSKYDSS